MRSKPQLVRLAILVVFIFLLFIGNQTVLAAGPYPDGIFPADEVLDDDLFIEGNQVEIAGTVHGMVFALGSEVVIRPGARIDGDTFLLAQRVVVEQGAMISGNLITAGQTIEIRSSVERSLFAASASLTLTGNNSVNGNLFFSGFQLKLQEDSGVKRNLYAAVYQVIQNGLIDGNARISAVAIELNSTITGDAMVRVGSQSDNEEIRYWMPYLRRYDFPEPVDPGLRISDNADIKGRLVYTSANRLDEAINTTPGGGIVFKTPEPGSDQQNQSSQIDVTMNTSLSNRLLNSFRTLLIMVIFAGFIYWLFPNLLRKSSEKVPRKPVYNFGVGFMSIVVVYIGAFVLAGLLIILVILLGAITFGSLSRAIFALSFTTLAWILVVFTLLMIYGSKLVVTYWFGKLMMDRFDWHPKREDLFALLLGIIMFVLVSLIPFIGWLVGVVITLVGLGAVFYAIPKKRFVEVS